MRRSDCRDPSTSAIDSEMHRTGEPPSRRIGVTACNSSAVAERLRDSVFNLRPEGTHARQKAFAIHRSLPTPGTWCDRWAPKHHTCLFWGAITFRKVAGFAGSDEIFPAVMAHGSAARCGRSSQHESRSTGTGSRLEQKPLGETARPVVVGGFHHVSQPDDKRDVHCKEGERTSSSPDSIISALSARTRHVALRADTTLSGSKLALSTSTFLIA